MKKRYRIGLILGMVLPVVLFGIGYGIRAHRLPEKKLPENVKAENLTPAEGDAQKNSGYYLKDLNGYLAVYLQDGQTLLYDPQIENYNIRAGISNEENGAFGVTYETAHARYLKH